MSFSMQQIDRIRGSRVNLSIGHRTVFWQSRELLSLAIGYSHRHLLFCAKLRA
jgi:hypothetical protein